MANVDALRVQVEVPRDALGEVRDDIAQEMLKLWLLQRVRQGELSFSRAAELAHMPLEAFLDLMLAHHISPFSEDIEDLREDLR